MKKPVYFSFLNLTCTLFVCLFFFVPKIYAEERSYVYNNNAITFVSSSSFSESLSLISSYGEEHNYPSNYILFANNNSGFEVLYGDNLTFFLQTTGNMNFNGFFANTSSYNCRVSFNSSFVSTFDNCAYSSMGAIMRFYYPLYSTYSISITTDNGDTATFEAGSLTTSITLNGSTSFPTLADILGISPVPPTPPDNTPLLTQFYSLCLDKMALVVEEFSSNYIYLSIIAIIIFTSILLIIKRRLF